MAEGLRSAAGPAACTWFPWLPEGYLSGLRGRCSGWARGCRGGLLAGGALRGLSHLPDRPPGQGWRKGAASSAREPGTGGGWGQAAGRETRGIWLHSLISSPTSLSPRGGAGRGQCPVGRSGRGRRAGGPQPLSPGRRPAGPRVRLSSELTPSGGRWVPGAGHSRTSLSGHWAEQERAGQFLKRPRRATSPNLPGGAGTQGQALLRPRAAAGVEGSWAEGGACGHQGPTGF